MAFRLLFDTSSIRIVFKRESFSDRRVRALFARDTVTMLVHRESFPTSVSSLYAAKNYTSKDKMLDFMGIYD